MAVQRRIKIFRNGRNQAVRIPREFALPGDEAVMRQEDGRLVIEPVLPKSLRARLAALEPIDDDFAPFDDQPPESVEL